VSQARHRLHQLLPERGNRLLWQFGKKKRTETRMIRAGVGRLRGSVTDDCRRKFGRKEQKATTRAGASQVNFKRQEKKENRADTDFTFVCEAKGRLAAEKRRVAVESQKRPRGGTTGKRRSAFKNARRSRRGRRSAHMYQGGAFPRLKENQRTGITFLRFCKKSENNG